MISLYMNRWQEPFVWGMFMQAIEYSVTISQHSII